MALLLQDISLTLPLPNEELAFLFGGEGDPIARVIDTDRVDLLLGDLERVNSFHRVHVEQTEDTVGLANAEDRVLIMRKLVTADDPALSRQLEPSLLL